MEFGLKERVALVTGASRGIGREIALTLARNGVHVAINYSSDDEAAREVESEIRGLGRNAFRIKSSVADYESARLMVKEVKESLGAIDILVNNAGILRDKLLINMQPDDWTDVINTNLIGVFNVTRNVAFSMMRRKKGKIVNLASLSAITGSPGQTNYTASKAGIIGFTKSLARELAPFGINVNAVAPGYIETDMLKSLSEERLQSYLGHIPLQRFGKAGDVAGAVLFLCSEMADYITGQVLQIDGGLI